MTSASLEIQSVLAELAGCILESRVRGDGRPLAVKLFITHHCMCDRASCLWKHDDWADASTGERGAAERGADRGGRPRYLLTGFVRAERGRTVLPP